jgi:hypothetical protein
MHVLYHVLVGEPLYDCSNQMLSCDDHQMMQHHQITLSHLKTIFKAFSDQSSAVTEQGNSLFIGQFLLYQLNVVRQLRDS